MKRLVTALLAAVVPVLALGCSQAPQARATVSQITHIPAIAKQHHMRYRVEIANGKYEKLSYLQSQISDPRFDLNGGF